MPQIALLRPSSPVKSDQFKTSRKALIPNNFRHPADLNVINSKKRIIKEANLRNRLGLIANPASDMCAKSA
jgi:hypothetical protein